MVVATSSRARLHDLACFGRVRRAEAGGAGLHPARASCRQSVTDATSIGDGLPPGPRATSSRPETDDLVASNHLGGQHFACRPDSWRFSMKAIAVHPGT